MFYLEGGGAMGFCIIKLITAIDNKMHSQSEMWSQKPPESVTEVVKSKIFLGGMPPDPPSLSILALLQHFPSLGEENPV